MNWRGHCGSDAKESACNAGDLGLIRGLGRSPGQGKDYPLQHSALENSMDCVVRGVAKSQTRLSDSRFVILIAWVLSHYLWFSLKLLHTFVNSPFIRLYLYDPN